MTENKKFEYLNPKKLENNQNFYFAIPESIILDGRMSEKRIGLLTFLLCYLGRNEKVLCNIDFIVKWLGHTPNRCAKGINNNIRNLFVHYKQFYDFLIYDDSGLDSNAYCFEVSIDSKKLMNECASRFALIYIDEVQRILDYGQYSDFNNTEAVLLVFAYLRMSIFKRRNLLTVQELNVDNTHNLEYAIDKRKQNNPEAYCGFLKDIAEKLNITKRTLNLAIDALVELDLIYYKTLPRIKYQDKYRTDYTVFANTYKREGQYLLASGHEYYLDEVNNKIRKIK